MTQKVLSYDLGGTKVAVGVVTAQGRVLEEIRVPIALEQGKKAVINQIVDLGLVLMSRHRGIKKVGMASAGPLDPTKGELLDPTNFVSAKGSWGRVPITKILKERLKRPVYLDNDAAAAILAEKWIGSAKKYKNAMILTLGTGLGTGMYCNGKLVRAGRNLHPEGGHIIIKMGDPDGLCGCGAYGCAEAYLSGRNFERRGQRRLGDLKLTAKDIADRARKKDPAALTLFEEYSEYMTAAIQSFIRLYCPEIIIFAGSFAATGDLFLAQTKKLLKERLLREREGIDLLPKLEVSKLKNNAGLIGGGYIALNQSKY